MILSQLTFYCRLSDPSPSHLGPRDLTAWSCEKGSESEVTQLCPTLCDPMDCSLPDASVHGILQARTLELVAISFSRESFWPRDWIQVSCIAGRLYCLNHQGIPGPVILWVFTLPLLHHVLSIPKVESQSLTVVDVVMLNIASPLRVKALFPHLAAADGCHLTSP